MSSGRGLTPRASIEAACRERGEKTVATSCNDVLNGHELNEAFAYVLAGPPSRAVMSARAGGLSGYWSRTWALRGLSYAWDGSAQRAVIASLSDESWRVREMTAKVGDRRRLGDALSCVARLHYDAVPRVRAPAEQALITLVEREA
jgi:hypothetical protein